MTGVPVHRIVWWIYWFFVASLLILLNTLLQIEPFGSFDELTTPLALLIPVATTWTLIGWPVLRRQMRVDGSNHAVVRSEYMKLFFLRLAFAEAPMMIGFAIASYNSTAILFLYAMVLGAVPFALAAPTERTIDRLQDELTTAGSSVDVRTAIRTHEAE